MEKDMCLFERFSKTVLGLFFLITAIGFILSGITIFPIFGFLLAVPALLVSLYFFRTHLNRSCQIGE
ncbi:MAG: hypothetical protein V3T59_04665 [Desulfobacterales bacterium]